MVQMPWVGGVVVICEFQTKMQCRNDVLRLYKRILRSAFDVAWLGGIEDAVYAVDEARRLFRQNKNLSIREEIERKIREGEVRHDLAVHYRIPRPRMFHKSQGGDNRGSPAYALYLDSYYDNPNAPHAANRVTGFTTEGSVGKTRFACRKWESDISRES